MNKTKPIILNCQEYIYFVKLYDCDDLNDAHSVWTSIRKAEEACDFLKHAFENPTVTPVKISDEITWEKGYSVSLEVNSGNIYGRHGGIGGDKEKIKKSLEEDSSLSAPIMIHELSPVEAKPQNFLLNHKVYERLIEEDKYWFWTTNKDYPPVKPLILSYGYTPVDAYERALDFREIILDLFKNLPERICEYCGKTVKSSWIIGQRLKNSNDKTVRRINATTNLLDNEYIWSCGETCRQKYLEMTQSHGNLEMTQS